MRNMLRRPATRDYPRVRRAPFADARGHVDINLPGCIYCGMCSRRCPVGAIRVTRAEKRWEIDRFRCVVCGECVRSCPKKCLSMGAESTAPAARKTTDVFAMPPEPAVDPAKEPLPAASAAKERKTADA